MLQREDRSVTPESAAGALDFGVARRTVDFGVDTGGGSRRASGVIRLRKAAKRSKRLAVTRRHTKKASSLHSTELWPCSSFEAAGVDIAPSTMQGISSHAADAVCPKSGRCVTSSSAIGSCHNADPAVKAGRERVLQGSDDARACAELGGSALSSDKSSRWVKVRGSMRGHVCPL